MRPLKQQWVVNDNKQQMNKFKKFTPEEIFVTLAIIAWVVGFIVFTYNAI
jgi:hypothetical protein